MPELERSGIQLVLGGFNEFVSGLGRINRAVQQTQRAYSRAARDITNYGNKVTSVNRRVLNQQDALGIAVARHFQALARLKIAEDKYNNTKTISIAVEQNLIAAEEAAKAAKIGLVRASRQLNDAYEDQAKVTGTNAQLMQVLSTAANVASVAWAGLGIAVSAAQTAFRIIGRAIDTVMSTIRGSIDLVRKLASAFWELTEPLRSFVSRAFSTALGFGIFDIFKQSSTAILNVVENLGDALSMFQRLNIQFEAISARDIAERSLIPMGEAFFYASRQAEELLAWVKEIAVTTPFSVDNLSQTLAMANAFGLNVAQAKDLTTATGNFVAAMGLTEDHMFRIIYNFGQMLTQGKLNRREFRDLANSFVPVWSIMDRMAKQAGMTRDAFLELAFEGGVPVEAFFNEFISMANNDFPGAMEKMSRTAQGVTNNIKDFIETILGIELLGPSFDRFTEIAASALNKLLTPAVRRAADFLGNVLARGVDYIIERFNVLSDAAANLARSMGLLPPTVGNLADLIARTAVLVGRLFDRLADVFNKWAQNFANQSSTLASNAAKWGYNVIAFFARGMAAAARLVVQVITFIASAISYLLESHSPPRILPDLPKWGMKAMASYLHGFTQADFDVLKGLQDPIREALSILEETGQIGENSGARLYKDISMAISRALSQGKGFGSVISQIQKTTGPFGSELAELARRYFDLADATKAAEDAQRALDAAQRAEERARTQISEQVREYNRLIREGVDSTGLRTRLAEINATEDAARAATGQRKEAESTLETLEGQVEALREAVSLQEQLVEQLLSITREQIIQIEVATGGGIPLDTSDIFDLPIDDPLAGMMDSWELRREELQKQFQELEIDNIFGDAEKAVDDFMAGADLAWQEFFVPFQTDIGKMQTAIEGAAGAIQQMFNPQVGPDLGDFMGGITAQGPGAPGAGSKLEEFFLGLSKAVNAVDWGQVAADFRSFTQGISEDIGSIDWTKLGEDVGSIAEGLASLMGTAAEAQETFANEGIGGLALKYTQYIGGQIVSAFGSFFNLLTGGLIGEITSKGSNIDAAIKKDITGPIEDEFTRLDNVLITESIIPDMMQSIYDEIITTFTETKDDWVAMLDEIEKGFIDLAENVRLSTDLIKYEFEERLAPLFDTFVTESIDPLLKALTNLKTKLDNVISRMEDLEGMGVDINGNPSGKQHGGPVRAGQPYIVGERGWEVFVPNISGFIMNQRQLARVYSEITSRFSSSPSGYAYGGVTNNSSMNVDMGGVSIYDNMSAAEFDARVKHIMKQERMR